MALPPNPGEDDPLGGMDPMAWLESLAKRQGANPDELTTKADLDVPLPTGDYKIDEPGYTPGYDTGATKPVKAEAKQPELPAAKAPPPPPAPEPVVSEPVASVSDDPLGGMDPMAWLESLAKRQGANADELTTTADLDVPLPTGNYVIEGPGYTPGYDLPKSAKEEPKRPEPPTAKAPPPPPTPEPEPVVSEPVASVSDDPLGGMDPMAWLESLAKRQGANADELTTTADLDVPLPTGNYVIEGPGYTPGYDLPKSAKEEPKQPEPVKAALPPSPPPAPIPEPEPVQPEPVASVSDDPLGGMDPMAWLESLAKRQGANADELTTTADLDVPLPTGDYVIDEPGYTPGYDLPKSAKEEPKQPEPVKAALPPAPPPEPEPVVSEPAAALDPMADPMAWLESLAKRQGANTDELTTKADLDVPLPTGDYVIDEPGYVPYDPFGTTKPRAEASTPEPTTESVKATTAAEPLSVDTSRDWLDTLAELEADKEQQISFEPAETAQAALTPQEAADFLGIKPPTASIDDPLGGMDPFEWLENLSREQGIESPNLLDSSAALGTLDVTAQPEPEAIITTPEDTLAWLEGLSEEPEPTPAAAGTVNPPESVDELGGLSDDPEELQRWLSAQATNLDDVRSFFESAPDAGEAEPIPGEIPSWLLGAQPTDLESDEVAAMLGSAVFKADEQLPPTPEDFPTWLREERESELDPDFVDFTPTQSSSVLESPAEPALSAEELQSLIMPESEQTVDSWAEALDEEFERRQAGDDSIPDWYLEAIARASEEATGPMPAIALPSAQGAVEVVSAEEELATQLQTTDLPDWLSLGDTDEEVVTLTADNIPDWLQNAKPDDVVPISEDDLAWLSSSQAEPVELPDWLQPMTPVAEVTRAPEPPPPPVKKPEVKPPEPAKAVPPKQTAPAGQRIHVARKLAVEEQVPKALEVYQQLIDDQDGLEEVRADLRELVKTKPKEPRAKRLLGDTHMRLGDLQSALDAYRSALSDL